MAEPPRGLGAKATSGFAVLAGQAGLTKILGLASQLVLAAILFPSDFGLVALVMSVVAFSSIIQSGGVKQVLIHRTGAFDTWAPTAFWLSMMQGVLAALLLVVAAPLSAAVYDQPELVGLLLIASVAPPFVSASLVSEAKLQVSFRFGFIAAAEIVLALLQAAIAIGLAYLGFGAVSIILAMAVVAVARALIFLGAAPPPIRRPEPSRWRQLFSQSAFVLVATLAYALAGQAAVIALGLFSTTTEVGLYFFAFNLSIQAVALLTNRLQVVLLPTVSSIDADPVRRMSIVHRTTGGLALLTVPLYALLIVVSGPLIESIYADRWDDAIPILMVLSLAMIARSITPPAGILLLAEGRFRSYMWTHVASAALVVGLVVAGVLVAGALGAAWAVACQSFLVLGLTWIVAGRRRMPGLGDLTRRVAPILVASLIAAAGAFVLQSAVQGTALQHNLLRLVVAGVSAAVIYLSLVYLFARSSYHDVVGQLSLALRKE